MLPFGKKDNYFYSNKKKQVTSQNYNKTFTEQNQIRVRN